MIDAFERICLQIDEEFDRNRRLHAARIQCRPGCTDCCQQLFQITEVEAAYISRGMKTLDAALQEELKARARPYLEERQKLVARTGEPEAWGSLPAPGTRLPCPALRGGVCAIYDFRPLICRKFGMPLYNPDKPGRVFACELNFRDGEEIHDPHLIQIQTGIHQRWKAVEQDYNDATRPRDAEPLTVARAILEDFSRRLD